DQTDYLAFIERMIVHYRKVHGHKFKIFTLDSLGALYSLMENTTNMRKRMFYFFKMLRDNELTSLVVMERSPDGESQLLGNEGFLVDGIVLLGLDQARGKLVRSLQLEKKLRSRDAEFKERESSRQEQASKLDEDRRMTEQERTALAEERDSIVGREKGLRAREKELEQKERGIDQREQEFTATKQEIL